MKAGDVQVIPVSADFLKNFDSVFPCDHRWDGDGVCKRCGLGALVKCQIDPWPCPDNYIMPPKGFD